MLDHVFTDAITVVRDALEDVHLERMALEERFQVDVLLGDYTWQTSYGLPGESLPARIRADLTLDWPTWAQTAYRNWAIGEPVGELPAIDVTIVLRIQELGDAPDLAPLLGALDPTGPVLSGAALRRSAPTVERVYHGESGDSTWAAEVTYDGTFTFDERSLTDGVALDEGFGQMAGWISATLVRIGDLEFGFRERG